MIAFLKAKEGELLSLKVIYKKRYETTQYFYDSTQQGCRLWVGGHGTPIVWQISQPYLNQGGQIMPTK